MRTCAKTWVRTFDVFRDSMATSDGSTSSSESFPAEPLQPRSFHFPKREFGKMTVVKRSFNLVSPASSFLSKGLAGETTFNPGWFDRYKWLRQGRCILLCLSMYSRPKKAESEPQGRRFHLRGISELEVCHSQFVKA